MLRSMDLIAHRYNEQILYPQWSCSLQNSSLFMFVFWEATLSQKVQMHNCYNLWCIFANRSCWSILQILGLYLICFVFNYSCSRTAGAGSSSWQSHMIFVSGACHALCSCVGVLLILLAFDPRPFKGEDFQDSYFYDHVGVPTSCHRVLDSFNEFSSVSMYFLHSVCSIYEDISVTVDCHTC